MSLITITQSYGSGGLEVARKVANGLDWELFDDRKIQELIIESGVSREEFEKFDEKAPGFWEAFKNNKPRIFLNMLESVIYDLAGKGNGVIIGHGSQVLLGNFDCAFHVRLFASESHRANGLVSGRELSTENAIDLIRKRDREQAGFFKFYFHKGIDDPELYDLVVNTQKFDAATMASLVIATAHSEAMTSCSRSAIEWMDRLALEKRVRAALIEKRVESPSIYVEALGDGVVQISGFVATEDDKKKLDSVVRSLPGVSKVVFLADVIKGMYV
jgi:cytidylate kinase